MNIKKWLNSSTDLERESVAKSAGTTVAYLWQLAGKHRNPSICLARRLEFATQKITPDRVLLKRYTRPDVWGGDDQVAG